MSEIITIEDRIKMSGYALVPDFLSSEQVDQYKSKTIELWNEENKANSPFSQRHPQLTANNFPVRTRLFDPLISDSRILKVVEKYFNQSVSLLELRGINLLQCDEIPFLHRDSMMPTVPGHPIRVVVLIALEDFGKENGGTLIVPGSHHFTFPPTPENIPLFEHRVVEAPAGTAIFFDANLWHGPSANTSGDSRWALSLVYSHWFVKPIFDMAGALTQDEYESLTPKMKQLLGFTSRPPKDYYSRIQTVVPVEEISYKND